MTNQLRMLKQMVYHEVIYSCAALSLLPWHLHHPNYENYEAAADGQDRLSGAVTIHDSEKQPSPKNCLSLIILARARLL